MDVGVLTAGAVGAMSIGALMVLVGLCWIVFHWMENRKPVSRRSTLDTRILALIQQGDKEKALDMIQDVIKHGTPDEKKRALLMMDLI